MRDLANTLQDDLIRLHKSMTQTNSEVHSALSKALQEANENLSQQAEFATAIQTFQDQLLRDFGDSHAEVQSYFAKVVKGMETVTQSVVNRLSTVIDTVETGIAELNAVRKSAMHGKCNTDESQNVRQSNTEAVDLQKNVGRVFQQVVQGSSELAASQMRQWERSQDLASQLQESLGSIKDIEIHALLGAFGGIHDQLVSFVPMSRSITSN